MSWLIDTDVFSHPAKEHKDPRIITWLKQEDSVSYTSAVVIAQLAYWVRTKRGRQREALRQWLSDLVQTMKGRIYGFSVPIAYTWAELRHELARIGQPMPIEDSYIAATAVRHNLTIVTGNDRDFARPGLNVFNPFKELR
jgi:predicted nucleic acid-binding protein